MMTKKQNTAIAVILAAAVFLAGVLLYKYFIGFQAANVPPANQNVNAPANQNTNAPTGQESYSTSIWKTWTDGEYSKATNTYYGYSVMFPRDFDVFRGDQARGGYIGQPRVTLAFPDDAFKTLKTNYGEAYLTVSIGSDKKSVDECYINQNTINRDALTETAVINGVTFKKGTTIEPAAGNLYNSEIYRALRDNGCYEVALTVHTGNIYNYEPGTVTEFNQESAFTILRKMLGTFTFTNQSPN